MKKRLRNPWFYFKLILIGLVICFSNNAYIGLTLCVLIWEFFPEFDVTLKGIPSYKG